MLKRVRVYFKNSTVVRKQSFLQAIMTIPYRTLGLIKLKINSKYGNVSLKSLYRSATKNSIFFEEEEMRMCSMFPKKLIEKSIELFEPKSVLDLGCGVGSALDYFKSSSIEVIGVEGSEMAIQKAINPDLIQKYNLNKELNLKRKFDLLWSFEFVEHIHPNYIDNLLNTFSNHSDNLILSAARPGQGGEGHFNEQLPEYWIEKFKSKGYNYSQLKTEQLKATGDLFSENMLVFER